MKRALPALFALLCTSCVIGPEPRFSRRVADGAYCAPRSVDPARPQPSADAADAPASNLVKQGYTPRSLDLARAIGALDQIERLSDALARHAPLSELADLRGQINDTIAFASLDLASTIAHLSCEEGRATQIASDLRAAEGSQTRTLTAYSLVISALAALAGGVLAVATKDPVPGAVVGIGGGVAGGAFGFATLAVHRQTKFRHVPNILGEVWRQGPHPSFPDIVWAYLTRKNFSRTGDETLAEHLLSSWKDAGILGEDREHPSADRVALYFGEGGTYDADGLTDRANMLSDVREVVSLMNHGLRHLAAEVAGR